MKSMVSLGPLVLLNTGGQLKNNKDIQEYLLLKGVEAVAIHGSKCKPFFTWSFPSPC
jgi:hypothetical protein